MPSERLQRRIDDLLDQTEEAVKATEWSRTQELTAGILEVDPDNEDALSFRRMAEASQRESGSAAPSSTPGAAAATTSTPAKPSSTETASTPDAPDAFAGGRYQVSKFLGEGGKKRVFLAHDTLLDRDIAFALIKTDGLDDASRSRITREAEAVAQISHPNVVRLIGGDLDGETKYLAFEYIEGSLKETLANEGKLETDRAAWIAYQVAQGLGAAHASGVIHRDVKPSNILLDDGETARLIDFGVAVAQAFADEQLHVKPVVPDTIAKSLAIGNPADAYYTLKIAQEAEGSTPDPEIVEGIQMLAQTEGIFTETAGGVVISNLKKLAEAGRFQKGESVVAFITGNGLKTVEAVQHLANPVSIKATVSSFEEAGSLTSHVKVVAINEDYT
jgi:hypothetical protein